MKLVLTFKDAVKLYSDSFQYDLILGFVIREFNIKGDTVSLTFVDQDGDNITVMSNDDIEVMIAVNQNKEYVKLRVDGEEA